MKFFNKNINKYCYSPILSSNNKLIYCIDLIILIFVVSFLINDIFGIGYSNIKLLYNLNSISFNDLIFNMVNNTDNVVNTTTSSHNTNVQIVHNDGNWSNHIRSLFIYGTGAFRIALSRGGGSPGSRGFIIASTLAADGLSRVIENTFNDPNYVRMHVQNWRILRENNSDSAEVNLDSDTETKNKIHEAISNSSSNSTGADLSQNASSNDSLSQGVNNFITDDNGMNELSNKIVAYIMESLKGILEPVQVSYSNELLANQINDLSVLLFILSVLIVFLFIGFIINILILINSDKILNYFVNKYIRWYVIFNTKIISIEIIFLGISILYFMYILSRGILFIATHPIILS